MCGSCSCIAVNENRRSCFNMQLMNQGETLCHARSLSYTCTLTRHTWTHTPEGWLRTPCQEVQEREKHKLWQSIWNFYIFVATKRKKQVKFINKIVQLAPPTSTISHAHPIYFIYILWHTVLFDSFAGQLITFSGLRRAAEADFKTLQLLVCSTMLALPAVPSD